MNIHLNLKKNASNYNQFKIYHKKKIQLFKNNIPYLIYQKGIFKKINNFKTY